MASAECETSAHGSLEFPVPGMIPPTDPVSGFLPVGPHKATLEELHAHFVAGAPNEPRRQVIFDALVAYFKILSDFFPSGLALIDGGFTTFKLDAPHDVDVVLFPDDPTQATAWSQQQFFDFQGLLTLKDVIVGGQDAAYFDRIQPLGGLLDGFIAAPEKEEYWRSTWGSVRRSDDSIAPNMKGYLEVRW